MVRCCAVLLLSLSSGLGTAWAQVRGVEKVVEAEPSSALSLSVRVNGKAGRLLQTLEAGASLASGDLVEVVVGVDRPAYVYLVQRFADGTAAVLHPESGDLQLPGGLETRLPEPGAWYQLDEVTGEEHLYVVASERPLADADQAVADAIATVRTEGRFDAPATTAEAPAASAPESGTAQPARPKPQPKPGAGQSRPAPMLMSFANRGLVKAVDEGHAAIEADADGIAIYHFWFRHEPRRAREDSP